MRKNFLAVFLLLGLAVSPVQAATYSVDLDHTSVEFKIKHLFSNVKGVFKKFEGTVEYEPGKPETWKTGGTIDVASIDTNSASRDKHLLSADFFDAAQFPKIEFQSTAVKSATETDAKLEGVLKMHGVEKPVTLDVTINGVGKDPWGNVRASFTAATKINRKDFGMNYNQALDAGGFLLGEDVEILLEIEAIQK